MVSDTRGRTRGQLPVRPGPGVFRPAARACVSVLGAALMACGAPAVVVTPAPGAPAGATAPTEDTPAVRPAGTSTWSDSVLASLSLRDKAAQMVWPWVLADYVSESSPAWQRTARLFSEQKVGGLIISVGSPLEMAAKLNAFQRLSTTPLIVSADFEGGAGFRARGGIFVPNGLDLGGATLFPQNMALGASRDSALSYEVGRITALEGRALGVHVAFAPVVDVNNNPGNPVIGVRSFGEDPRLVGRLGAAMIRGIQDHGMIATAKHFPGHGDTEVNSHLGLPVVPVTRARLDSVELAPFRDAIAAGVGAVMTAHMALPLVVGDSTPATLSRQLMTDLLKRELGFDGLLTTDAMDMQGVMAVMGLAEATRQAVEAGNDVLLMPTDIPVTIEAIVSGVRDGRYTEARVDSSVRRILRLKEQMGVHRNRYVDLDAARRVVGDTAFAGVARRVAERGLTLVRDTRRSVPLPTAATTRVMSVTVARRFDLGAGRDLNAELRTRYSTLREVFVDSDDPGYDYGRILRTADSMDVVIIGSYQLAGFDIARSSAAPRAFVDFVERLSARRQRMVVISHGNPYLLREIPSAPAYLIAWSGVPAAQRAAGRALLGTVPITGILPISIPPVAPAGSGERRP
jgi:beta-N-acetylhexosaminidase